MNNTPTQNTDANAAAPVAGAAPVATNHQGVQTDTTLNTLPMAWFHFVVRGYLANGNRVMVRGRVCARQGLYYQAQARAIESIHKEIPNFTLDEETPIGLKMLKRKV